MKKLILSFSLFGVTLSAAPVHVSTEHYLFSQIIKSNSDQASFETAAWATMDRSIFQGVLGSQINPYEFSLQKACTDGKSFEAEYEIVSALKDCSSHSEAFLKCSIPEPATFALMGGGLVAAGAARFFSRKKKLEVKN